MSRPGALTFESRTWSWPEVDAEVDRVAQRLESEGIKAGGRVTVTSWNSPQMLFTFVAAAKVGAAFVPLNARLTEAERDRLVRAAAEVGSARGEPILAGLFTSGTTGTPKLVELTVANFAANARGTAANLGASQTDSWLCSLPLFHIGGLAMAYRWALGRSHLALEAQFDAAKTCAWLESGRITHASFVPTTLQRVLDANGGRGLPSQKIRALLIGGGPMTQSLLARARGEGLPVLQTYGLTEACSQVTTERLGEADGTTAGPPLDGVEVRIVDGEIQVRGPNVSGPPGRWLSTGDLGALDDRNRLTVFSRRVDLIITGGENVYPAEVERVLSEHPSVREVAVVGRPDALWGQVPVAFVVWVDKSKPAPILEWARERLAGFKVPRSVRVLDELPRNANGKLLRQLLDDQHAPPR